MSKKCLKLKIWFTIAIGDDMKNRSVWKLEDSMMEESLKQDMNVDVAIVGGGLAGMMTAYYLRNCSKNVILLEKDTVGSGLSSSTTGKLTYLQDQMYPEIEKSRSKEDAKAYFESQKEAMKLAKSIILKHNIDCNLTPVASYLFASVDDKELKEEKAFLKEVQCPFEECNELPISFPCKEAIFVHDTYCFHPVKFIQEIKKLILHSSVRIYENTRVTALDHGEDGYTLYTKDHKIKAQQVIITTHYPFFVIPKLLPLQLKLEKSYLLESERKEEPLFLAISTDAPHYTFRIDKEHFIFGGYSHNLASKLDYQKEKEEMMNTFKNYFDKEIRYVWSAHDVLSKDHLPFIGSISENHPNLFIATAFHKWGMTNSFLAGKLLSDLILEKENPYQELFSPTRNPSLKGIVDATMNDAVIGGRYLQTKMQEQQVFYKNIHFEKEDDEEIAVYTDEDGMEHKIKYRCPHLKSGLIFDESEKIWICPAHGSRFDVDGHLLEGPSTCDITYEK